MASLNGGKASFAECLAAGLKNVLPLTGIALVEFVVIGLGFVVLIVPGIIMALMFSVVAPIRVIEGTGVADTFSRSTDLTHGYKGQIFALLVIYYVLAVGLGLSARPLAGLPFFGAGGTQNSLLVLMLVSVVTRTLLGILNATGVASIYYELRLVKEGHEPEQLASVFA
jgi:hypothetical protein